MDLATVIAQVESSGNQYAQRFEKLHLGATRSSIIVRTMAHNGCSLATADVYCAMSHGLFQIMGYMLYGDAIAYDKSLWTFMTDRNEQVAVFNKFLKLDLLDEFNVEDFANDKKARTFASLYNGPNNTDEYIARIRAAIIALTKAGIA
jgi:hypothetical protein